ncbi:hypothetical protein GL58_04470 [Comamonas testosteroni]|uniref:Uncharacterized protein n=1 Tax=Comamonas testosteroni TaxID=285 RepID=A0A0L7MQH1_COMTE|nr:hypothetical protein GL58_04470 [Comamonas testosteroni]
MIALRRFAGGWYGALSSADGAIATTMRCRSVSFDRSSRSECMVRCVQTILITVISMLDASGWLSSTGGVRYQRWREAATNFVEAIDTR